MELTAEQAERLAKRLTHCDGCGDSWYDSGLINVTCPTCRYRQAERERDEARADIAASRQRVHDSFQRRTGGKCDCPYCRLPDNPAAEELCEHAGNLELDCLIAQQKLEAAYGCTLRAGHDGPHIAKDGSMWTLTGQRPRKGKQR